MAGLQPGPPPTAGMGVAAGVAITLGCGCVGATFGACETDGDGIPG